MNPVKSTVFNNESRFLFRRGMTLRQWQVKLLFGDTVFPELYPDDLEYYQSGAIRGKGNILDEEVPYYNIKNFKMGCPTLFQLYVMQPEDIIPAPIISGLSDFEVRAAFFSGYLKHDTRGHYFTKNKLAFIKLLQEQQEQ